jgi:hypothetical protein
MVIGRGSRNSKKGRVHTGARGKAKLAFNLESWVNVYPIKSSYVDGFSNPGGFRLSGFLTRDLADVLAGPDRIACIRVLIQGREGDGLKLTRGRQE